MLGYLGPITAQQVKQEHLPTTGFSGVDLVGQAGLEEQYNKWLQGTPGQEVLSVNSAGQQLGTERTVAPQTGDDLVTSINAKLQGDLQSVLASTLTKAQAQGNVRATTAAGMVMTTTGRVVAMASVPTYNPSIWTDGISQRSTGSCSAPAHGEPILNRVTQGEYAPGSTFKVMSTAAAVKAGYSLDSTYNCPASFKIGGRTFANDGEPPIGPISLHEALVISCDTVFYELAYQIYQRDHPNDNVVTSPKAPAQEMQKMELDWGFGNAPGIDLPEQSTGTHPDPGVAVLLLEGQRAHRPGLVQVRQGQRHATSSRSSTRTASTATSGSPARRRSPPSARATWRSPRCSWPTRTSALANGGTLYSPRIGEALHQPGRQGAAADQPAGDRAPAGRRVAPWPTSGPRCEGPWDGGTAAGAFSGFPLNKVCVAGKTGTARGVRQLGHLGVRLVRAVQRPEVRGGDDDPQLRTTAPTWPRPRSADLGRHLRPGGP